MDFAKKMMEKYGWKEGDGLGKNRNGMSIPLKAHLKFDTSGFGVDKASDFNNHWWQRVYNEAASNIKVEKNDGNVCVLANKEDSFEITNKEYSISKIKTNKNKSGYNHFLKSSTLTNFGTEVEDPQRTKIEDLELPKFCTLTDEQLFAACGGRTAHKGARHGLNLTGKLQRVENQDRKLSEVLTHINENSKDVITKKDENEWITVAKHKNKKNNGIKNSENEDLDSLSKILHSNEYIYKSKKKRKEQKHIDTALANSVETFGFNDNLGQSTDKILKLSENSKKIKRKSKKRESLIEEENVGRNIEPLKNEKIKSFKQNQNSDEDDASLIQKTKSKKNKNKDKTRKSKSKSKINCGEKVIAKKIKKTMHVLENLDSFLSIENKN